MYGHSKNVAWLEDFYIPEEFRGLGVGKEAMEKLDELMREKAVITMFVDVLGFQFKKY
ncbi:GNAT family N-acetyltransferase [Clostridium sp. CF012]|uniref:GNAT family N-acetyltransferase n=1 Tax=Clostridium sp. CF012 TaxID=2843319 RepID=UPI0035CB68CC